MENLQFLIPFSLEVGSFFIKAAIIIIGLLILISFAIKEKMEDKIVVKDLNEHFKSYRQTLLKSWLNKKEIKQMLKDAKKDKSDEEKTHPPRSFFISFNGDIKASAVDSLREEVTALLCVAEKTDEIIVSVESPGGMVHGYGLAASQLQRIKDAQIPLTICVDKVAASGGYMMACLADKIVAAPFSIIGSVGVVASLPNFNKLMKKNNVDYYQITSGKFKRTVSLLGEVTDEGLEKFKEEIEATHVLFKNHIKKFRPQVDVEKISTGEHWYGQTALELKLIDELGTSDDYLYKKSLTRSVKKVTYQSKKSFKDKLSENLASVINTTADSILERLNKF